MAHDTMSEAFERLERLRAMIQPGQQTWDLSERDVQAIRMAVGVIEVIIDADRNHEGHLETYDVDSVENPKMLQVGRSEFYGETAFECFLRAWFEVKQG